MSVDIFCCHRSGEGGATDIKWGEAAPPPTMNRSPILSKEAQNVSSADVEKSRCGVCRRVLGNLSPSETDLMKGTLSKKARVCLVSLYLGKVAFLVEG